MPLRGLRLLRGLRGHAVVAAAAVAASACAAAVWPRAIEVAEVRANPALRGEWIASYEDALAAIQAVLQRDLGLPPAQATLQFHRDGDAFRAALEADGYDPAFARETAATLIAVTGHRRVLINDAPLRALGWPERVSLLAHELTHTLQYEWGGGTRGTSDQWLREGFAEWVEVRALIALGFTEPPFVRRVAVNRARASARHPLSSMVTFPDWVRLAGEHGQEAVYAQALLAAELLLERHGLPPVIGYFQRFAGSSDRLANFRAAFGEDVAEFERTFAAHLADLLD